jgi:outer membrane protein assembly factor BamE
MAVTVSFLGAVLGSQCHGILALFPPKVMVMRHLIVLSLVVISLLSVSCTSQLPSFRPYKMDIQQGNVVTSKMMMQLRPGMTKSQVRFIMGTPLIQDSFHSNRWDYFYQMRKDGKVIEQRRVIMDFENEALLRVRGDVIPAGTGDPATEPTTGTEPVSQPDEKKKGLVDKLKFWKKDGTEETSKPQDAPEDLMSPAARPAGTEPANAKPAESGQVPAREPATAESVEQAPAQDTESRSEPAPVSQPSPALEPEPITDPAEPAPQMPETAVREESALTPEPAASETTEPLVEPETKPAAVEPAEVKPAEIKPSENAAPAEASKQSAPKQNGRQLPSEPPAPSTPDEAPPQEGEPGYFEYMLEKIGF